MMRVATLSEPNYPPVKPRWLGPATTVVAGARSRRPRSFFDDDGD
jgi:hypothetical protein